MTTGKAVVIGKRHDKECAICMLLDVENPEMEFHPYKVNIVTGTYTHVCNDCVEGIKEIRKKCHLKVDNPSHKIFDGFEPWFIKHIPEVLEAFRKNVAATKAVTETQPPNTGGVGN